MIKILLPTDFTATSERVYRLTAQVAKATGATVTLCNLIPTWTKGILNISLPSDLKLVQQIENIEFEASLEKMLEIIQGDAFKGVKVNKEIKLMSPRDWKEKFITETDNAYYDLVIIGHNETGKEILFFTDDLSQRMRTPVLACTKDLILHEDKPILICVDFEKLSVNFFDSINLLNRRSKKVLFYVNTQNEFMTDEEINLKYEEVIKNVNLKNTSLKVVNGINVVHEIKDEIERGGDYQFVALASHSDVIGIKKIFITSVTETIIDRIDIPVLSVNIKDY